MDTTYIVPTSFLSFISRWVIGAVETSLIFKIGFSPGALSFTLFYGW